MSQNIVAICDCDLGLLDGKLAQWTRAQRPAPRRTPAPRRPKTFKTGRDRRRSSPPTRAGRPTIRTSRLQKFVNDQIPRLKKYQDYREMLDKQKDIDGVIVATPDHMHAIIASASMDARQARLRAEAAVLVGARSESPGEEGGRDQARHADGQPAALARRAAARRSNIFSTARSAKSARCTCGPTVRGATGRRASRGRQPRRQRRATGWDNRGVMQRLAAAMKGDYPVPTGLNWDLFLGVAPKVDYHPIYHPFNWRGWVDWGQGALGDMGAHLIDFPMWALDLGLPSVIETESTPFNGATYPDATTTHYEFPNAATCRRSR